MDLLTILPAHPEKINDPWVLDSIIKTLDALSEKYNVEYAFFHTQSLSLGESYQLAPVTYLPSKTSVLLEPKFDRKYFEQRYEKFKDA